MQFADECDSPLLECVLAQTVAADGEARHVGRGNYKVRYWDPAWQEIICGSGDSYLNRILAAGFDGVYLDIIDAFEYFEK